MSWFKKKSDIQAANEEANPELRVEEPYREFYDVILAATKADTLEWWERQQGVHSAWIGNSGEAYCAVEVSGFSDRIKVGSTAMGWSRELVREAKANQNRRALRKAKEERDEVLKLVPTLKARIALKHTGDDYWYAYGTPSYERLHNEALEKNVLVPSNIRSVEEDDDE